LIKSLPVRKIVCTDILDVHRTGLADKVGGEFLHSQGSHRALEPHPRAYIASTLIVTPLLSLPPSFLYS
jgi:hypothetical protein